MAIRSGQIIHVGGSATLIDRLQSAGPDISVGNDPIREIGNYLNVDKLQQDPEVTFNMESFDVSTEVEALLVGKTDGGPADADGTQYLFSDFGALHIISPWKDEATGSAGTVDGGVVVPNLFCTRASYRFGVDDNAGETFELSGAEAYEARKAPAIEQFNGNGASATFVMSASAARYSVGGYASNEAKYVLGVIVEKVVQVQDVDYTVTTPGTTNAEKPTVIFTDAPATGEEITIAYFDATATPSYPQTIHPTPTVKPAAVRGRDIKVWFHIPASGSEASGRVRVPGVQSVTVDGSKTTTQEREMGTLLPIGRTVENADVNGEMGIHPAGQTAFFRFLRQITGVASAQVVGPLNNYPIGLEIAILNPNDRSVTLKTIWVPDAKFNLPGVPAQAGSVVDFSVPFESAAGDFSAYKAAKP